MLRAMFCPRPSRALATWLLLALILFNGLACAIGHGQMMAAAPPAGAHAGHEMAGMAGMDMGKGAVHSLKSPFEDCFFAGSVPLAMLVFAALGWLARHRPLRVPRRAFGTQAPPRWLLPALNPRAP
ncbi:DUF2946 family protein [Pseudomonas sp. KNUC1026]|uniref:DUF2946 family protein n=1 Tax=Pseudomonas sp. KNUC1026 TaxID=2893890 RepID=UPI001F2E4078|nr:DUF2946 family protein [Pseudomonas sp. KNUC1026]UFH49879.1 DUF2946 family protein [Pseudomonas sp. KNUC1026]